jgi:hypothetical protein
LGSSVAACLAVLLLMMIITIAGHADDCRRLDALDGAQACSQQNGNSACNLQLATQENPLYRLLELVPEDCHHHTDFSVIQAF